MAEIALSNGHAGTARKHRGLRFRYSVVMGCIRRYSRASAHPIPENFFSVRLIPHALRHPFFDAMRRNCESGGARCCAKVAAPAGRGFAFFYALRRAQCGQSIRFSSGTSP